MKVLVLDDLACKRFAMGEALTQLGLKDVTFVTTTNEGLRALDSNEYDLLILDNNFPLRKDSMPVANAGLKLLHRLDNVTALKDVASKIKVIMFSSDEVYPEEYSIVRVIGSIQYQPYADMARELYDILIPYAVLK